MTPEKKPGLKVRLAQFAKEKYPNWINGGDFETFAMTQGKKASNGSRRCRELADEGTLERRINGKSVEYRYKLREIIVSTSVTPRKPPSMYRCSQCSKDAVAFIGDSPGCKNHAGKTAIHQPAGLGL